MDEASLQAIYNAYKTGEMLPDEVLEYEADVKAGTMQLPQGASLSVQEETPQPEETPMIIPSEVTDAYFSGIMTPQEKQEFEQDAGSGAIKLPEGISITPIHTGGQPGMPETSYKLEKETDIAEKLIGAGETALTLATGATGGLAGQIGGTLKGLAEQILSGEFGTPQAGEAVKQAAQEGAQALTYEPGTEAGREYTQAIAEILAPLEALGPLGAQIETAARAGRGVRAVRPGAKAAEAVKTAERAGVTPITTDIFPPKTFAGKLTQAIGERIPVVGTGPVRATQQAQRASAIKSFLSERGAIGTSSIIDDVMSSLTTARKAKIDKFRNIKSDVFAKMPDARVNTTGATRTISSEISRLKEMKTTSVNPLIKVLDDFKQSIQDQNIVNIEALRKQLGDQLDSPDMISVSTEAGKSSKNIYRALNDDIGSFVKKNGEPKDFNKWKIANKQLSETIGELQNNALKSVLRQGDAKPEAVKTLLFSQKPSDIKILYKNLNREGRANARTAILHEALEKAGGVEDFTPERFTSQIKRLQKSTGIFFAGDDKKALEGLQKALKLTRQAGIAGVKAPTGAELTAFATPTALTWMLGSDPVTGLAATAGVGGLARLYESKAVRNTLINIANAPKGKELPLVTSLMAIIESQKEKEE